MYSQYYDKELHNETYKVGGDIYARENRQHSPGSSDYRKQKSGENINNPDKGKKKIVDDGNLKRK